MSAKDSKKKDLSHVNVAQIKRYVEYNQNTTKKAMADKAVEEFLDNYRDWKDIMGYIVQNNEDGNYLYGAALCVFSGNLTLSKHLSESTVEVLKSETIEYENNVRFSYEYKYVLYSNIVICLKKLSNTSNDDLKALLKKSLFYSLCLSNHTSYQVDCYAYRSVNKHLINAIRDEKLNMSSPITFNDPFDCPVLELLNLYGDGISKLVREVYQECLKITCFVKNTKVEPNVDKEGNRNWVRKHKNDPDEYLNELMWAHYANNHKGVCIKYHFNNDVTKFADTSKDQIAYFRDIKYTSNMNSYKVKGSINLQDAFFVKGKAWEYENELRLLAYDLNGSGKYSSIDTKNSIAAVYFGLKCPKRTRARIMNMLKGRKWVSEGRKFNESTKSMEEIKIEQPVKFFQMEVDKQRFGKLKAVEI